MKKSLSRAVALSVAIAASTSVYAEERSGFTVSPMVGYTLYGGDVDDFENDPNGTIAVGYKFDSPWAVELAYLVRGHAGSDAGRGNFDVDQIRLDGLYHFVTDSNWRPYAAFGIGESEFESNDGRGNSIDEAFLNGGFGVNYILSDWLSLRGDARAFQNLDSDTTDFAINVGLNFLFGGGSSAPAPVVAEPEPEPVDGDSDQDGVLDSVDACPFTAAGVSVDATGCEINNDLDGDGVLNSVDKCPDTQAGAKVDEVGCYIVLKDNVTIQLNVKFANNSDQIVSGSDQIRDLANFMKEHPLTKVVVEGHTDSRGSEAYNQSLSQKRAVSVANTLSSNYGIQKSRVTAIGYGESNPVASNDTAEGRAENRRVTGVVSATVERVVK